MESELKNEDISAVKNKRPDTKQRSEEFREWRNVEGEMYIYRLRSDAGPL
jgi:hypothetical protein